MKNEYIILEENADMRKEVLLQGVNKTIKISKIKCIKQPVEKYIQYNLIKL